MVHYNRAVDDFRRARNRASLQELVAQLTGKTVELLSYEDVRRQLRASGVISRRLQDVPIDAIIGSVGRSSDFTRGFLPRHDSDKDRWARVMVATTDLIGLPPIELYQLGDVYFVADGHHRVSVAKQNEATEIQAFVTEIRSSVPLNPDIQPEELIVKAEYADFLRETNLDRLRPGINLDASCAAQYRELLEHIEVHQYYMGIDQKRTILYEEAVIHWFDEVYQPVVEVIRDLNVLREFPDRTETDLYLWLSKHRAGVTENMGWQVDFDDAAADLVTHFSDRPSRMMSRIGKRVLEIVLPEELEPIDSLQQALPVKDSVESIKFLFSDILVAISGSEPGWLGLEQALEVAKREEGILHGLLVAEDGENGNSSSISIVRDRFYWRCGEFDIGATFVVEEGPVARTICEHARWTDLVVVPLTYPPDGNPINRIGSGFRSIIKRCMVPVLAIPGAPSRLSNPILAFDGSEKARAALYVAAYLCRRWDVTLTVISVDDGSVDESNLQEAEEYLSEQDLTANFVFRNGDVVEEILSVSAEQACDLLIMGAYGRSLVTELILGTVVDKLLNQSAIPMLICK